jgi:hypothetical protein
MKTTTLRNFIKTIAVPVAAAPFIIPSRVWSNPPGNRITMGFIAKVRKTPSLQVGDISTNLLIFDVFPDNFQRCASTGSNEIARRP